MKKLLIFALLPFLLLSGCGDKNVEYANVYRDKYSTGGDITFSYDKITHTAYFGGENEVVQFYDANIAKGWDEAGNRVGVKLVSPCKITNPLSAKAQIGDKVYENGSFYSYINGKVTDEVEFFPLVSEEKREVILKIVWQDGVTEQTYKIIVKEGSVFMKNGY